MRWLGTGLVLSLVLGASPAAAQGPIRIGFFATLTGAAAADGASAKHSAEMAAEELSAEGGIGGHKVELLVYDDRGESRESIAVAIKLVERDGVTGAVSGSHSTPSRAMAPVFARTGLPLTVAYATHPDVTRAGACIFRNGFLAQVEGGAGAEAAVKLLGARRVAVLTVRSDFGAAVGAAFAERARKLGAEVLSEQIHPPGEKEFGPYLARIREQGVDLIYLTSSSAEGALVVRKARELGVAAKIEGTHGIDSSRFAVLTGAAAEGVIFTTNLNRDDPRPEVQRFLRRYKARTGAEADMVGASSYDAVRILARGIALGGTGATAICSALAGLTDYPAITGRIARFVSGEAIRPVQIQVIRDGKVRSLATIDNPDVITPPPP
ncbi:MAG TPA: ABC transporter substrate-binding protein [Candidatus Methylomirabilis sp.]|nr:ABC transporter substrate-binding protein [Candidatus Methylomirabilis sp.]